MAAHTMCATPTTVMATDLPLSPSTESDASSNSFTDDYETLPADGPITHAHILAISSPTSPSLPSNSLHLQDALVTTLFHASPSYLERFLDPTVNTFKIIFKRKDDTQLVIWRKGIEVFTGTFHHHPRSKHFAFTHLAGFLIGYDGAWRLKLTAGDAYSKTRWTDVWVGKFACSGGVTRMRVEWDEEGMRGRAGVLAGEVVAGRFWEGGVVVV